MTESLKQKEQLAFLMSLKTGLPDYTGDLKKIKADANSLFNKQMLANVRFSWKRLNAQRTKIVNYFTNNKARGLEFAYKNEFIAKFLTAVYSKIVDEFAVDSNLHTTLILRLHMDEAQYFIYLNKIIDYWGNILLGAEVSYFEHKNDREMSILPADIDYAVVKAMKKVKVYNIADIDYTKRFTALDSNYQEMILKDLATVKKLLAVNHK